MNTAWQFLTFFNLSYYVKRSELCLFSLFVNVFYCLPVILQELNLLQIHFWKFENIKKKNINTLFCMNKYNFITCLTSSWLCLWLQKWDSGTRNLKPPMTKFIHRFREGLTLKIHTYIPRWEETIVCVCIHYILLVRKEG